MRCQRARACGAAAGAAKVVRAFECAVGRWPGRWGARRKIGHRRRGPIDWGVNTRPSAPLVLIRAADPSRGSAPLVLMGHRPFLRAC